jgi:hypothetical protein
VNTKQSLPLGNNNNNKAGQELIAGFICHFSATMMMG